MTDIELFDVLDPETWEQRPLQKVFVFPDLDLEDGITQEEMRMVLFKRVKEWTGQHLEKIENMKIERFSDVDEITLVPRIAVQIRFNLKAQFAEPIG